MYIFLYHWPVVSKTQAWEILLVFFVCLFTNLFIYFFLCWVFVAARRLFSSCGEQGLLFVAVRRLLIAVASLVAEHRL